MTLGIRHTRLDELSPQDCRNLRAMLMRSAGASVFHTVEWNRCLIEQFNLQHDLLLAEDERGFVGVYWLFPAEDLTYESPSVGLQAAYGGPAALGDEAQVIQALLAAAEDLHPLAYFKVWSGPRVDDRPFEEAGYGVTDVLTSILSLDDGEDRLWSNMHRDKRYTIRRALSRGLQVVQGGLEHVEEYHEMVQETLSHGGLQALPLEFLQRVLNELAPRGMARLLLVRCVEHFISGTLLLYHGDTVYGWNIGWRREFSNLSPNDLLVWETAVQAQREGLKRYDLLRVEPDRLPGIAKWKSSFGGRLEPCYFFRKTTAMYRLVHPFQKAWAQPERVIEKFRTMIR